jgi:hypothetical protein
MCASKLACFDGVCKDPCVESKPCGRNAICKVENSLPVRTMVCECIPGYVGNAEVECRQRKYSMNFTKIYFTINFYKIFPRIFSFFTACKKYFCTYNLSLTFCSQFFMHFVCSLVMLEFKTLSLPNLTFLNKFHST